MTPASSTLRAMLKLKCEPWPTSILRPRASASFTSGCSSPIGSTKPPGCRLNGCARMSPGLSRSMTSARMVSGSTPYAPLARASARAGRSGCRAAARSAGRSPPASRDHVGAPAREAADLGVRLDALDEVAVGVRRREPWRRRRRSRDGTARDSSDPRGRRRDRRRESEDAALRGFGDVVAEARQGHAARAALVDQRRHAGVHAAQVGVQAEAAGDVLVDVGVGVDQCRAGPAGLRSRCAASPRRRCRGAATAAMRPSRTPMSKGPSRPCAGSSR